MINYEILLNINSKIFRINDKIEVEFISRNKQVVIAGIIKDINIDYIYIYNLQDKLYYVVIYSDIISIKCL